MIRPYVVGTNEVVAKIDRKEAGVKAEMRVGIGRLAIMLQRWVQQKKLSGQVLGVKTGRLRRSIAQDTVEEGSNVVGIVSTAVNYGIGWEMGWPGRAEAQSLSAAKWKFSLAGPDTFKNGTPKQRSFLRTALKDMEATGVIGKELEAAISRALK